MGIDAGLRACLMDSLANFRPESVIESGTFVGLGSTTLLASSLQRCFPLRCPPLYTIEVSFNHWQQATKNLREFRQVRCLWGLSVTREQARQFIATDEAIRFHEREPDIYIDNILDPARFYLNEIDGALTDPLSEPGPFIRKAYYRENWLPRLLKRARRPLVVLDSAGAIGYLEFSLVRQTLQGRPYLLLLDDIDHLKHFRSRRDILGDSSFTVLGQSLEHGWLLAEHRPA